MQSCDMLDARELDEVVLAMITTKTSVLVALNCLTSNLT